MAFAICAGRILDPQAQLEKRVYTRPSASRKETEHFMDTFPDLGALSDQELKELIQQLTEDEQEVSYRGASCTARSTSCAPSS